MDDKYTLIKWNDEKFSVHVTDLDSQHKRIIDILNEMFECMKNKNTKVNLPKAVTDLEAYAEFHLAAEENYFKLLKYPETEAHIKEHEHFRQKVAEFNTKLEQKTLFATDIFYFMKDWMLDHIAKVDKKYSKWFNDHGVK